MRHIPNILTCLRIAMVIAFILFFVKQHYIICLILYVAAFLTDVLDGYLARKFNWVSDFGKLVDPFADKFMLLSALICLVTVDAFPLYLMIILGVKELLMVLGGLFLLKKQNVAVYADMSGKLATGLFFVSISLSLVRLALAPYFSPVMADVFKYVLIVLYISAVAISIYSLFHYAYKGGFIGKKYRGGIAYKKRNTDQ